ncbi:MAG TPA: hypothetical protein DDZ88_04535 [Verrucomicrobiales bacterium]|nr:hypothetical protein [Verrucomicrobiales bacterium]
MQRGPVTALIHGTVTAAGGEPLEGIALNASDGVFQSQGVTNDSGQYVLGVAAGNWQTLIPYDDPGAAGYLIPNGQNISLSNAQAVPNNLVLTAVTAHIQGVVTRNSLPVAGIQVRAFNSDSGQFISMDTASDGTFDLGLVAGTWTVQIDSWDAAAQNIVSPALEYTLATNQTLTGVTLALLDATANISGFVRDGSSAPINAFIYAETTIDSVLYAAYSPTQNGNYSLPVVNGTWEISVEDTGDFTQPIPVSVVISGANATQNFTLSRSPLITIQPLNQTVDAGQTCQFSIQTSSGTPLGFQWRVSTNSGFSWNPLGNDNTYSGVTSSVLNVTSSLGLDGYRYHCVATNSFGSAISDFAQITVNALTASGSWRQQYFGTSANTGNAADTTTPDGDNIPNLLKYALVIIPGSSGAAAMPAAQRVSDRLTLIFTRDPARNDVTITVQANNTLTGTWTNLATSINGAAFTGSGTIIETDASGGRKTVEVRDTVPISGGGARFMRIQVIR